MSTNPLKETVIDSEYSSNKSTRPLSSYTPFINKPPPLKSSTRLLTVNTQKPNGNDLRSNSGEMGEMSFSAGSCTLSLSMEGEELHVSFENLGPVGDWVMETRLKDSLRDAEDVKIEDLIAFFENFGDPNDFELIQNELGMLEDVDELRAMILYDKDDFLMLGLPAYVNGEITEFLNDGRMKNIAPVVFDRKDLMGRTGQNEIRLTGKNLDLIDQVYLKLTHETVDVDFELIGTKEISLMFVVEPTVKTSLYQLSVHTILNTDIELEILIRGASNPLSMRKVSKEETMKFLANHFVWNGKCHEIIFAPDITKCIYRDEDHVNQRDIHGATDLIYSIKGQRIEIIDYLLSLNINVNLPTYKLEYPMHFAAEKGDIETIQKLLEHGADHNVTNMDGESPLYYAEKNQKTETVAFLMQL